MTLTTTETKRHTNWPIGSCRLWLSISTILLCLNMPQAALSQVDNVRFVDATSEAGLSTANPHTYAAAAGDFNRDGFVDLLISHHGPLSLWQNNNGTFADASSLIGKYPADKHGVSFVDLNGDGFIDIAVSVGGDRGRGEGNNIYYMNVKGSSFIKTSHAGPTLEYAQGRGRSIVPLDYNRDGKIDLLLMNYVARKGDPPHRLVLNGNEGSSLKTWHEHPLGEQFANSNAFGCSVVNLDCRNQVSLILTGPGRDAGRIFQEIKGTLTDVTEQLGIDPRGCMAVVPIDYDNDGDLDLYYGRGLPPPPTSIGIAEGAIKFIIFDNQKKSSGFSADVPTGARKINLDIRFEQKNTPKRLHLGRNKTIMPEGVTTLDLAIAKVQGEPTLDASKDSGGFLWRDQKSKLLHYRFIGSDSLQETEGIIEPSGFTFSRLERINIPASSTSPYTNSLYRNDNGHFTDVGNIAHLDSNGRVFSALAADFNNDSFQDLYVVNIGQDIGELNPPNSLYLNNGDGTFAEVAAASGAQGPRNGIGSGAVAFDYNGDRKIDIFLFNGNTIFPEEDGPLVLLKNTSPSQNGSTDVYLSGAEDTQAWGSCVRAQFKDGSSLLLQKFSLNGYVSASDIPFHVGYGKEDAINSLSIIWPSGKIENTSK